MFSIYLAIPFQYTVHNASDISFKLITCPIMPDSLWRATSMAINSSLEICWKVFPGFLFIRLLSDWALELYHGTGRINFTKYVATAFEAMLITAFLASYKWTLAFFDDFIYFFCINKDALLPSPPAEAIECTGFLGGLMGWFFTWLQKIENFDFFFFTQRGAIMIMNTLKAALLMLTAILGPFATIFTLLPGPFRKGFSNWVKSYIHISCWSITLSALASLILHYDFVKNDSWYLSWTIDLVLMICIYSAPSITAKFIGSAIVAPLGQNMLAASRNFRGTTKGALNLSRTIAKDALSLGKGGYTIGKSMYKYMKNKFS